MRNILTLITAFFVFGLAAQRHQLTTGRNAYRSADRIVKQQVEFKDPGIPGRQLRWDFGNLQPINQEYKLDFFIPDSSQMDKLCGMEHNTRYYYNQKQDSLWATGFENSTTVMEYLKPELKLRFPFSYGDTLRSDFEGVGQYSHRLCLKVKGSTHVEADAEGELILPNFETVKRALRIHTLRYYTQTGRDSVEMTLDTYSWYAAGIRYPVFESVRTTLSKKGDKKDEKGESMKDSTVFSTSFYYPPEKQTSQVETAPIPEDKTDAELGAAAVFTEAQLMPNPVIDNLYIKYKLVRSAKVWFTVHNSIGIPQRNTSPQQIGEGEYSNTVPMGGLIPGVYCLFVHVDDMVLRLNVVKK